MRCGELLNGETVDKKIHELFKLAMWDEHISHSLYLSTAGRTKDRDMKKILLNLAADEKKHFDELEEMHDVLCCQDSIEVTKVGYPNPTKTAFMSSSGDPDIEAFLAFAMEKENSALNYYLDMAQHLDEDKNAGATLLHFSAMEADHYKLLKSELERIKHSKK